MREPGRGVAGKVSSLVRNPRRTDHSMTHPLHDYLGSGDALGRLREHSRRLRGLQALLERLLPAKLAQACPVANLKDGTLVLLARNGSIAARMRQLLPTLQRQLGEQGTLVSRIEVRVRPTAEAPPPPPRAPRSIGRAGRESLVGLEHSLPEDSELRRALSRLVARARDADDGGDE